MTRLLEGLTFTSSEQRAGNQSSGANKDEVIMQQLKENEELKRENEELKKVKVTGEANEEVLIFSSFFLSFSWFTSLIGVFQGAQKWNTDEVIAWLEREGLGALGELAGEKGFDGSVLFALYEVRLDGGTFMGDCNALGIPAGVLQIKLKGKLVSLFG